jgi:membrane associated rhomboid family serine protease
VKEHTKTTRQHQGSYGGSISANPRLTSIVLIAINVAIWGIIQMTAWAKVQYFVIQFLGLLPRGLCVVADQPGAYYPDLTKNACQRIAEGHWVPGIADGAWWQIFTSIFTHVAITHIALNCLCLWFLGPPLESLLGRLRFLVTYIVSGIFGSLAVYWLSSETSLTYGGSGSLFGLMGCLLVVLWLRKSDVRQLLMWLGLNVMITFIGGSHISWQGHLGGLVGGALLGCIWGLVPAGQNRDRTQWILIGTALVLLALGLGLRTWVLVSS